MSKELKNCKVSCRLTENEKEQVELYAAQHHMTVAQLIRILLLDTISKKD